MKVYSLLLVVLFSLTISTSGYSLTPSSPWSITATGGFGFTLTPDFANDYYSNTFSFTSDLIYMFSENIGFIPIGFSYNRLYFNEDAYAKDYLYDESYVHFLDASAHMIALTPGAFFTTSKNNDIRFFGQGSAGIFMLNVTVEDTYENIKMSDNKNAFGIILGGGIEINLSYKMSLIGMTRYYWANTNQFLGDGRNSSLAITGGIKYYF